tara:strand:+ start:110 stop:403 length:294 start_codon:yes stop_codon:yes gene_type:complete
MKYDAGTTNVPSAGTRVQLSNTTNRVRLINVKALAGNSGLVYFGVSDVSASNGYELSATNTIEIDFADSGGTVAFSTFYVDAATNGDDVCWSVILDG